MWGQGVKRGWKGLATCPILVVKIKAFKVGLFQKRPQASFCLGEEGGGEVGVVLTDLSPHSLQAQTYPNFKPGVFEW